MTRLQLNGVLALTGLAAILAGLMAGSAPLSLADTLAGLIGAGPDGARLIVLEIRLPRVLAAFLTGAALGASGALLQGLLRNPLADPGVLGVSAMAALGAVIAIWFGLSALSAFAVPVMAIAFAGLAAAVLAGLAATRLSVVQLILAGVGLSSFAGALSALAMNLAPTPFTLSDLVNWLMGSVANRSFADLALAAPFWIAGAVIAVFALPGLRALTLGEETAASLGADITRTRLCAIIASALLTGGAVAVAGIIGFVGIVAPHLVRPLVRHDPGDLVLPSALAAGALLALADLALRLAPFPQELKLGVAAALVGAPAFIWIAARSRSIGR
ncbi:iron ABC transporter permease [Alkalicaulis satelles]|uniref:Iron ABC transporter permease n=1 Tax=Alkalicaulis satelles TaxID=2609175 RepID=A0A5M6ZIX3_9PROT|nr:iron ABC transporter permease [Alkalicaulis satelles]KAA5803965.1 iron ABC transporter permease [Alkalicaulis satelles]